MWYWLISPYAMWMDNSAYVMRICLDGYIGGPNINEVGGVQLLGLCYQ